MSTVADALSASSSSRPRLDHKPGPFTAIIFVGILAAGLLMTGYSLENDIREAGGRAVTWVPYILLAVALVIALGFEFVNGFHDTANAVATVIYTHSLPAHFAVLWSGFFNFLGVLVSSGAVAFDIISLLPVELILQVGSSAGFAMVFALLIAAIIWNLGTWWLGLPASSSHTLIDSIIGVGVANALMHGRDYAQGASAELVAMSTIGAADAFGLPVSTTHVLSSGVAGTMAANRSGLQMATIRNLLMAWVMTLPAAILLSGSLYWVFSHLF